MLFIFFKSWSYLIFQKWNTPQAKYGDRIAFVLQMIIIIKGWKNWKGLFWTGDATGN